MKLKIRLIWRKAMTDFNGVVVIKEWEPVQCPTCGGIGAIPKDGSAWRTARKRLGLSQRAVAEAMGVSHAYVGELERGTRRMTSDVRRRYTDAMLKAREGEDGKA